MNKNVQKIINKGFCYAEDQDGKIISEAEIKKEASKEIKTQTKEVSK